METIDEVYEKIGELEEDLEDLLDGISEVIDLLEDGETKRAVRHLRQIEASLQDFLRSGDEDDPEGFEVEIEDEDDDSQ